MKSEIRVNMGEMKILKGYGKFVAYGVGSCVVVVCYDETSNIAGMLHALLPEQKILGRNSNKINKYVDSGIENMIKKLINEDVNIKNIRAKIFGGAKMFETQKNIESIGDKNVKRAKEILSKKGIKVVGEDTGRNYGRTIEFDIITKKAIVKSFSHGVKII